MIKQHRLFEDKLSPKLFVGFSSKITKNINVINSYNQNNINGLTQWCDYLNGIRTYLSNPVIAWDYTHRFSRFPNGAIFIKDFDYNIGYTIKTNNTTNQPYVYVFMVNQKSQEFGLIVPPTLRENRDNAILQIIAETINNYLRKNILLVS